MHTHARVFAFCSALCRRGLAAVPGLGCLVHLCARACPRAALVAVVALRFDLRYVGVV